LLLYKNDLSSIKLIDFGMSAISKDRNLNELFGTDVYIAPEVFKKELYGPPCDCWSLGVLLYILVSGIFPFYGDTFDEISFAVQNTTLSFKSTKFN